MSPEMIAPTGQTTSQLGLRSSSTRWAQKLHFAAVWELGSMYSASYGHAFMHALQPMQRCGSKSTIPSSRLYSALTGHTSTQGAFVQWLQRSTAKWRRASG